MTGQRKPEVPRIKPGTVLHLAANDWRYGDYALRLRADEVRDDLSRYYDNEWVWILGYRLGPDDEPLHYVEALVKTEELLRLPGKDT
jgi:hypothetical protein